MKRAWFKFTLEVWLEDAEEAEGVPPPEDLQRWVPSDHLSQHEMSRQIYIRLPETALCALVGPPHKFNGGYMCCGRDADSKDLPISLPEHQTKPRYACPGFLRFRHELLLDMRLGSADKFMLWINPSEISLMDHSRK